MYSKFIIYSINRKRNKTNNESANKKNKKNVIIYICAKLGKTFNPFEKKKKVCII